MSAYNQSFYTSYADASRRSATEVLGHLFKTRKPASLVDVGCGIGTWLKAAQDLGIAEIDGLDGSYVKKEELLIPAERFHPVDLSKAVFTPPNGKYDMAISMEVGEHLDAASAEQFVSFITSLSDVVLLSAAIPHQGGTQHVNEQWPSYWGELFEKRGYLMCDVIRPTFWEDDRVEYYYAQNAFVYVKAERASEFSEWTSKRISSSDWTLRSVCSRKWLEANTPSRATMRFVAKALPHAGKRFLVHRFKKLFGKSF